MKTRISILGAVIAFAAAFVARAEIDVVPYPSSVVEKPGLDDFKRRAAVQREALIKDGVNCGMLE